jgi:hypothetical protein
MRLCAFSGAFFHKEQIFFLCYISEIICENLRKSAGDKK